jgi:hypothetical protein
MPAYTYLAADTMTGTLLAELPLSGVTYDLRVNDSAQMHATLPLDSLRAAIDLTEPDRLAIYVMRGDTCQFGGILWGWQYAQGTRTLTIDCGDFLSYLDRLFITSDLTYAAVEQLAIARSLVSYGMGKGGSNLSPAFTGATTSGITRDRNYVGLDEVSVGQRLRELSAVDQGFDFRISARMEGNYPRRTVQFGYPTLGRAWPASRVVFEVDADSTDFTFTKDGGSSASVVYAVGGIPTGGTVPPTYTADDPTIRTAGYPRLEYAVTYSDITELTTLTAHAKGELALRRLPIQTATLTLRSGPGTTVTGPDLGEYLPGDQCKLRVARGDALFPYGAEIIATVTAVSVAVDDEHNDAITVNFAVNTVTQGVRR